MRPDWVTAVDLQQGSPEWHALRGRYLTASVAPQMMGTSPYNSRGQLIEEMAGIAQPREVTPDQQARFDAGHAAEADARFDAEMLVGGELRPLTLYGTSPEGLPLLASLDGITDDGRVIWEHKLYNASKAEMLDGGKWPHDLWQMEQQLYLSGADFCIYHLSDGYGRSRTAIYRSDPVLRSVLLAGWRRLLDDVEARKVSAAAEIAEPETALAVVAEGRLISSNLPLIAASLRHWLAEVSACVDIGASVEHAKRCKRVEERCQALHAAVINQTADIADVLNTLSDLAAEARQVRLRLEKLADAAKNAAKAKIIAAAAARYKDATGGHPLAAQVDWASAGKRCRSDTQYRTAIEAACDTAVQAWRDRSPIKYEAAIIALVQECGLNVQQAMAVILAISGDTIPGITISGENNEA